MTDTVRTEADLLTRIQKQMPFGREGDSAVTSSKDQIIPQDLRDLIVSVFDAHTVQTTHGQLAITSIATEQALAADTFEPIESYDLSGPSLGATLTLASGKIAPVEAGDYRCLFSASLSAASADTISISFALDGTEAGPVWVRKVSNNDIGAVAGFFDTTLTAGQEITIHVKTLGGANVTFTALTFGVGNLS